MAEAATLNTIETQIPARMDRLPWSKFHRRVVAGLGTVWILDGLEVTIVGAIGARLTESGSGAHMTAADIGYAAGAYVAGACLGALFFGQLTDRFGRKKLMMLTLAVYILATVATAFAFAPWFFFLFRFFTGAGIGGEYAAINSAIDELIPARNRGQVDITINGSFWVGSAIGSFAALLFLSSLFPTNIGWRIAFGVGAVLGLAILLIRRTVPESPRWLFIHGREQEAERIVDDIETMVKESTHRDLPAPKGSITVRQREAIPFTEIAKVAFKYYPTRAILGLALFIGQAFLYNAVTFDLGTIMHGFFKVSSSSVPYYTVAFAVGNFLGPLLLGRYFDSVGRRTMISVTYLLSSALTVLLAVLMLTGVLGNFSFIGMVALTFFFASAGASSAYLTVSEIFPMETRALAIAFFYAVGTGIGGIAGPLLFGNFINSGRTSILSIGFFIGAAVMSLGGFAELFFGVRAERVSLENIAKPLTAADAEQSMRGGPGMPGKAARVPAAGAAPTGAAPATARSAQSGQLSAERVAALEARERAEEEYARAAEHRATVHELQAASVGAPERDDRIHSEQVLAEMSGLRARMLEEQANSHDERAAAADAPGEAERRAALARAEAAEERSRVNEQQLKALSAEHGQDAKHLTVLADAAGERARAHEQEALAAEAQAHAEDATGVEAELAKLEADMYGHWAEMHVERALIHEARAGADSSAESQHEQAARVHEQEALADQERLDAVRHRGQVEALQAEEGSAKQAKERTEQALQRDKAAEERDERIRARIEARRQRQGARRFLPGPASGDFYSPGMLGTSSRWAPLVDEELVDSHISAIAQALEEQGPMEREKLMEVVGGRYWGPGRFRGVLQEAVDEGRVKRVSRNVYGPAEKRSDAA